MLHFHSRDAACAVPLARLTAALLVCLAGCVGELTVPQQAPDAPTIGTVSAGDAQVSVTFTLNGVVGSSRITAFTVTCTPTGGAGVSQIGTSSPIVVTGLTNGTEYGCNVTATNGFGTSAASATALITPAAVPDAPTIGTATPGSSSASITFTAPVNNNGAAVTSYTATCSATGQTAQSASGATSPITLNTLVNGVTYLCNVKAKNSAGLGAASADVSVTPVGAPSAPGIGTATSGNSSAIIAFSVPTNDGGSAITGYTVTCTFGVTAITGAGTTSPVTVSGLANGRTYSCSVKAANVLATSSASGIVSVLVGVVPGAPTILSPSVSSGSASVFFSHITPSADSLAPVTGFTVTCVSSGQTTRTGTGTASPISVTSLTNGATYLCNVKATNAIGTGAASADASVAPVGPPPAPTIGVATPGNTTASVAFTVPSTNGGSAITGYTATCTATGQTTRTGTGAGTPIAVASMVNGAAYTCSVTATNSFGTGPASSTVGVTPRTVPSAPTIGTATAGNTVATVAFTANSNGGSTITGFTVTCTAAGQTTRTGTGSASPIQVNSLTNNVAYTCSVTATNAAGTSAASGTVSVSPTAPPNTSSIACNYTYNQLNATLGFNSYVQYVCNLTQRTMKSNQVPDHAPGTFPNPGNPNAISAQTSGPIFTSGFSTVLSPAISNSTGTAVAHTMGFAINGVKFDPATAETCSNISAQNKSYCPSNTLFGATFNVEALGQTLFSAGVDNSNAHVQPDGAYHYHGVPQGYMDFLAPGQSTGQKMVLVGFMIDGFPVYSKYGFTDPLDMTSAIKVVTSGYSLKSTPDAGRVPYSTIPNGTFTQDWQYTGLGDLDECNGRYGKTPEFPSGIYHYYITDTFPYIQRCVKGSYLSLP